MLFDMDADPDELQNLAADPSYAEPEAAFADSGDEVLAAFKKKRRKEGKQKQKQKQGGDNGGAVAAAAEGASAVQVEGEPVDEATLPQKRSRKT